jgi:hypothetical protein
MARQFVVIGTSPFFDLSVAVGPFRSAHRASAADDELASRGWNTEVCELMAAADVDFVTNDEGVSL